MSNSNSRDEWLAMWEVTRRPVPTPSERDEHTALRDAVAAERAAVVAWLRSEIDDDDDNSACVLTYAANAIDRGEHRREGEP
jgi:hypothetical protein